MMVQLDKLERAYEAEAISEREVLDKRAALLSLRTRIADVENQIPATRAQLSETSARRGEVWTKSVQETKARAAQLRQELSKAGEALGAAYREMMGRRFPAMAVVGVTALVEPGALVEIEATAVVPRQNP